MPTYDYRCSACGHEFEEFQSITAPPLKKCPKCGKNRLDRLIGTGAGVIFKGSGFYETDYRSESYKKAEKAESGGGESKADGGKGAGGEAGKGEASGKPDASAKPAAPAAPAPGVASPPPAPKPKKPEKRTT